jgi:hypothetical protein
MKTVTNQRRPPERRVEEQRVADIRIVQDGKKVKVIVTDAEGNVFEAKSPRVSLVFADRSDPNYTLLPFYFNGKDPVFPTGRGPIIVEAG